MRQRADPALVGLRAQAVEAWRAPSEQVVKVPRQAPVAKPGEQLPSVMIAPEAIPQAAREYRASGTGSDEAAASASGGSVSGRRTGCRRS